MKKYCESIFETKRWKTREVMVGNVGVGGNNPVRIQSMTTSNTRDVDATVDQIIRLSDAGCEIARVTVQGMKEAEACEHIKNRLIQQGYTIPVVADIHFYPPAAMKVVDFVDKVRINPGNFVDKRANFKVIEYDDDTYAKEIEKIVEKFTPLVEKCKTLKRAMRIGTNHGSLSDRIMNRYGDSPQGMVESALEFARVCRDLNYHDFMFSMKSSNPSVMILAYRLLVAEMMKLGWDYPLHLGVTEAGEGEDGRIKSAMGIGTLLLDGIGDTIRVSLTEDPWLEIDPCKRLVNFAKQHEGKGVQPFTEKHRFIDNIQRREVILPKTIAMHRDGTVVVSVSPDDLNKSDFHNKIGCDLRLGKPKLKVSTADQIALKALPKDSSGQRILNVLQEAGVGVIAPETFEGALVPKTLKEAVLEKVSQRFNLSKTHGPSAIFISDEKPKEWALIEQVNPSVIFLRPTDNKIHYCRQFFEWLQENKIKVPVILNFSYACSKEDLVIQAGAEFGALLCDGLGDGIWVEGPYEIDFLRNMAFNILQAARMRTSKTDFISCPSCGRTLFDLQDVTKRIRERTSHLPGVKIAIMGCIVNGPGEMADADFGYVGSKPGMIDLYVGKNCVEKDINFSEADDRLVELIKAHGRWKDVEIEEVLV
ncbi:MAG: (E)-4-hydroxy-3-methylbut-2-enyl-diphosphate synthase [Parachlamydiaceae bacterium]|nr:(E)-4-hydroxy-3-methylbut-2-enyl-diphosphate synthase [Parachlamydiaceae bacterium]